MEILLSSDKNSERSSVNQSAEKFQDRSIELSSKGSLLKSSVKINSAFRDVCSHTAFINSNLRLSLSTTATSNPFFASSILLIPERPVKPKLGASKTDLILKW